MTFLSDENTFDISGIHQIGKSDKDVSGVRFKSSQLFKVPRVIFDQFTNLEFLDIHSTELKLFNGETFETCGKLKYLDASINRIRSIPDKALQQCTELISLNLNDNLISSVEPCNNFLQHLTKLTRLFLRFNICIDEVIFSDGFTMMTMNVSKIAYQKLFRCFSLWFIS